jgi:Flp pilus assembly protein TadG
VRERFQLKDERAQTATEFALVLPVLALLLFGIMQFGIVFNHYVTLTDATRAGARKAAVSRLLGPDAATSAATTAVRSSAKDLDQADLNVSVSTPAGWVHGADVTVSASSSYSISLLGMVVKSGRLTSSTTERIE